MERDGIIIFLKKDGSTEEYNIYCSNDVYFHEVELLNLIEERKCLMYYTNCTKQGLIEKENIFFFRSETNISRAFVGSFFFLTDKTLELDECIAIKITKF